MDAKNSADFYCDVFGGKITSDTAVAISIEIFGQKIMLRNEGTRFEKNASISFTVVCETEQEAENYWEKLSQEGIVLMQLGEYPWSKKYGWVRDKFGVTWQIYLGVCRGQKIIPLLMFLHKNNGRAISAMNFYTRIFPNSSIGDILRYSEEIGDGKQEITGNVQHAHFVLDGYTFFCMDNSHPHKFNFNDEISIVVVTDNQEETDRFWKLLTSNGGEEGRCGWLKDRYGVSWQIVPQRLLELMDQCNNQKKIQSVAIAVQGMAKIVIEDLENAYCSA